MDTNGNKVNEESYSAWMTRGKLEKFELSGLEDYKNCASLGGSYETKVVKVGTFKCCKYPFSHTNVWISPSVSVMDIFESGSGFVANDGINDDGSSFTEELVCFTDN